MTKEVFLLKKNELVSFANATIQNNLTSDEDRNALKHLLNLLEGFYFENRLVQKGILTHTILDSLDINFSIGERFINFEESIS